MYIDTDMHTCRHKHVHEPFKRESLQLTADPEGYGVRTAYAWPTALRTKGAAKFRPRSIDLQIGVMHIYTYICICTHTYMVVS